MAGITSVITLEDRFSGTIKLFTKLLTGTFGPSDLFSMNLGKIASIAGTVASKLPGLYMGFDSLKGVLQITSFGLQGVIEKFGNVNAVITKVSAVFPALMPFASILSGIFARAQAGESLFGQLANVVAELNLPFSGLVRTFLKIRDFFRGAGGKIIKGIAMIAAVSLALKAVLTAGMLLEKNLPKAFHAVKDGILGLPEGLKKLHSSLMLSDGPYGKYMTIAQNAFGKLKGAFGTMSGGAKKALSSTSTALNSFSGTSSKIFGKLKWNFQVYSWTALWHLNRVKMNIQNSAAYQKAQMYAIMFYVKSKEIWSKYSAVVKTQIGKAVNYIKGTKAYQYAAKYVGMFTDKAKAIWAKYSPIVKAQMDKAATYIKGTKAYQFASKYVGIAVTKVKDSFNAVKVASGSYVGMMKTYFKIIKNEASWFVIGVRARLYMLKESIKDGTFLEKAKMKLSQYTLFARMKWAWYSGIARSHLKKVTDYAKSTKAYQFLAEKYNFYMWKLKNSEGYHKAAAAMGAFTDKAKAHLLKLWVTIKATAIAQAGMFKSLVMEHGFFGGILKYIAYLKLMGLEFLKTKAKALGTFLLLKLQAFKTFIASTIASSSFFKTVKGGIISIFRTAKTWFGRLPAVVKAGFAVYVIVSAIKGIKAAFDGLGNTLESWREKVNDLIEKTNAMEKATRRAMQMGPEMAQNFTKLATQMSLSTGHAKEDILDFNMALSKLGVGNASNKALTDLAARFSTLNENMDFASVSNALVDAIKQGSADGLAELMNGNPMAKVKFERMHLDRMLSRGDINGFINSFSKIADEFGYTQDKADELTNTTQGKLKRIGANIDRLTEKIKAVYVSRVEPYIDKFLEFIQSSEFQMQFEQITSRFGAMLDMAGTFIGKLVDVGLAIYKWWIEPTGGALRQVLIFVGSAMMIKKIVAIFWGFKFVGPLFLKMFAIAKVGAKGLFNGIKFGIKKYEQFKDGGVANMFRRNMHDQESAVRRFGRTCLSVAKVAGKAMRSVAISPGIAFAAAGAFIGRGAKMLNEELTGESKGTVESIIEVVIGGCWTTYGMVNRWSAKLANSVGQWFVDMENTIMQSIADLINWFIKKEAWMQNKMAEWRYKMGIDRVQLHYEAKLVEGPQKKKFLGHNLETDEQIHARAKHWVDEAKKAIPFLEDTGDKALTLMGLKSPEEYAKEWEDLAKPLEEQLDDEGQTLKGIKRNTDAMRQKMDLQWMKELAEQRFVNNVNIRQMVPTVNVKVSGSKVTAQDTADALARELNQMADAGAFNAYGGMV